jgi:nitrate reductase gamma subunit
MFRIMSNSQTNLSAMADSKANIMISVNSIIISIMISGLLTVIISNPHLAVPFFLLVIVCVTAIVFSVLATRPKITSGRFSQEDIQNKKINLLFFGNFYNMGLQDYEWAMREMLNSRDYLYESMIKDIYFLGIVLAKKYKYLRISYNIFMYGLILVVIAFAVAIFFFKPQAEVLG